MRGLLYVSLLAGIVMAGCSKGTSLEGMWLAKLPGNKLRLEFRPDKTCRLSNDTGKYVLITTSSYKLDGDKLTMTLQKAEAPNASKAEQKSLEFATQSSIGKSTESTIKFDGDDKLTLTLAGSFINLVREK